MNLRFEQNQIRIRVLQSEANQLLEQKLLEESFVYSHFSDPIRIQIQTHDLDFGFNATQTFLNLKIPHEKLQTCIQNQSKDPVCELETLLQDQKTKITFEVDLFKKDIKEKTRTEAKP